MHRFFSLLPNSFLIHNVSSVAEFIEEIKRSFITELVESRSRFSNFSMMVLTNSSLMSSCFMQFKLTCFFCSHCSSLHISSPFGAESKNVSYNQIDDRNQSHNYCKHDSC